MHKTGEAKPQTESSTPTPNASLMAQEICNQILKDMKEDFTKMINAKIMFFTVSSPPT